MIAFNFDKKEEDYIFDKCGYVTEEILVHFPLSFDRNNVFNTEYSSMYKTIAYKKGERPDELKNETTYWDNISHLDASKTLENLVKNKILSLF